jgi:hypothetical protein
LFGVVGTTPDSIAVSAFEESKRGEDVKRVVIEIRAASINKCRLRRIV